MATNDATIVKIKHEILEEVAKLVFAGKFEEEKDELPLRLMPGPTAKYRCCVYKEREIVRQRVRLAEGRNVEGAPNNLVVQVVRAACEECPISRCHRQLSEVHGKSVSAVLPIRCDRYWTDTGTY